MTGSETRVTTWPGGGAGLDTLPRHTGPRVAGLVTPVSAAGERPAAQFATGDSLHQAGDVPPLLPPAVTPLVGQLGAGRTDWVAVAGVMDWVATGMFSPAGLTTVRRPGPARYWGVDDGRPTVTGEF